jgi:hypothetical protein
MGLKKNEFLVGKNFETEELAYKARSLIFGDSRVEFHPSRKWVILSNSEPLWKEWRRTEGGVVKI